jgi:hypothetical protein
MTSTITKAVETIDIVWDHINDLFMKSTSQEDKKTLISIYNLIIVERSILMDYLNDIRTKRRHAKQVKKDKKK